MRHRMRQGVHLLSVLLMLVVWQRVLAEDAPLTLQQKAEDLLKRDTPKPTTYLYYPDNDDYQSVWLRGQISANLRNEHHYGYSREQILRVKKFICIDSEGTPGLAYYQSIAKWQVENEFIEGAQQTLRDAVAFSRRLKANPPPKPRINSWCGCYEDTSPESRIACAMLRIDSSDEDVLSAAAEITPDWKRLQYMEEPYLRLAAQLGRYDLALELVRRVPASMKRAIDCERVAEEILHSGDHAMAKLAFQQTLDMIPDPSLEKWNRGDPSFPLRAAACLGYMGEYDLAAKFLERSKEFPEPNYIDMTVKIRAEQYLAQAALGKSKLPAISKDDPDYQKKVQEVCRQYEDLRHTELHLLMFDVIETIPRNDPVRFDLFVGYFEELLERRQELHQPLSPLVIDRFPEFMEMLPPDVMGNDAVSYKWRDRAECMAKLLIRHNMLEEYRDRFAPRMLARVYRDQAGYGELEYPEFGFYDSLRYAQMLVRHSRSKQEFMASQLRMLLPQAQNQHDAKRMARMLLETDVAVDDPTVYFLVGDTLLSRQMGGLHVSSPKYSVAGEKTEKDYYRLSDLMIEAYLRGEDGLAGMTAVEIIQRLWLTRDRQLPENEATRRHNEVAAAVLMLKELSQSK